MRLGVSVGQSALDFAQDQTGRITAVVNANRKIAHRMAVYKFSNSRS